MSSYFHSSVNDGYEEECVQSLPIHVFNATGIILCEPSGGYNRTVDLNKYPAIDFSKCQFFGGPRNTLMTNFEVDFLAHTSKDFEGFISPIRRAFCDDVSKRQVFYSNFIEAQVQVPVSAVVSPQISPNKDGDNTSVKYVIAEITNSTSQSSAEKKVRQIERCLWFLQQKTLSRNIEHCVALALIIGPEDKLFSEVQSHITGNKALYPLTVHLSDIGRLGFIENRNTLINKVATFGHDILEVKDRVGDLDAVLTEVKDQVSDVKDQVSDVKGQVSDVKGQVNDVKDQVSDVKDQVQLLVRLVSIMMMIILIRCVLFLCSLSGRTEKNQTDL